MTKIEWTEVTWNPVTGCSKISPGCTNCYAERMANRLHAMNQPNYKNGFKLTCHNHELTKPLTWKKPRMIFVCSMSDLFHKDVPTPFIKEVFNTMQETYKHTFQILTKRAERLSEMSQDLPWPKNIWAGVSVESSKYLYRIHHLRQVPAKIRFISLEPLLEDPGEINLTGIHWVIVGGESGPNARPISSNWVRNIRNQCVNSNIPFFFKQWGGPNKKQTGHLLDGQVWHQTPTRITLKIQN